MAINRGEHPEYIVVGLGNPGQRYENTRHNVGFKAIDYIEKHSLLGTGCKRLLHSALTDKCVHDGYIMFLVKPQTYMNNSGLAVYDVMNYYRLREDRLIVIYDDTSIPFGHIRIRPEGSSGGHNGIKSIIEYMKTEKFIRIRVGIGKKPAQWDLADYVLSRFSDKEQAILEKRFAEVHKAISCIMNYGIEKAMSLYNTPTGTTFLEDAD